MLCTHSVLVRLEGNIVHRNSNSTRFFLLQLKPFLAFWYACPIFYQSSLGLENGVPKHITNLQGWVFFSPRVWKHIQETKRPPKIIFHTWAHQDSRLWRRGLRHQGRRFAHSTNSMRSLHRWSSFEPTVMVKQLLHLHSRLVFCWGSLSGSPAKASDEWQFPTHPSKEKQRVLQDMICCWMINPSGIVDHIWKPCKTWTIWLSWPERQICNFIFILHS